MKQKKQLKRTVVLVLSCLAMLLTACSGGDAPTSDTGTSAPGLPDTSPETNADNPVEEDPNLLYNGIYLPEEWPPKDVSKNFNDEIEVPYLVDIVDGGTHPDVVNIDVGRQLFVDDFLIASTDLQTVYHHAEIYENNPVFKIDKESGFHLKHGGLYYNEEKKLFEMWYNLGTGVGYATSTDGINWTDKGSVFKFAGNGGGYATVVKDTNATADEVQYWMLVRRSNSYHDPKDESSDHEHYVTEIYYSFDGQNWRLRGVGPTSGDASTLIYNCFRDVWQFSLRRSYNKTNSLMTTKLGRARDYLELSSLLDLSIVDEDNVVFWQRADANDLRDPVIKDQPEIYSFCAIGYESIMLGSYQMLQGPKNSVMNATGIPKVTNLLIGYSRDGFYYSRPDRESFIAASQEAGTWDRGYLHQMSSVCLIVGDELWFYYGGYEGDESLGGTGGTGGGMNKFSIGLAKLRRDGFASLDGTGSVLTRKMTVTNGQKYLFINAAADSVKAEILDANGTVVEGFSMAECTPFSGDSTCSMLTWGDKDLSFLSGSEFQIRFEVQNGSFYAFWLSADVTGDSNGATAGGVVTVSGS